MKTMKKIVILGVFFASSLACAKVIPIASPADFDKEIKSGIVVVKFFAPWCSACKGMKAPYENISNEFKNVKFLEVDVDTVKKVADDHDIRSLPTFKYFLNGKEQTSMTHFGGGSTNDIKNNVNALLSQTGNQQASNKALQKNQRAYLERARENELLRLFHSKSEREQEKIVALLYEPVLKEKKSVFKKIKGGAQYAGTKIKDGFKWTKAKIKELV